ncbi:hypothetical protein [Peribacillus loiseleuriae]
MSIICKTNMALNTTIYHQGKSCSTLHSPNPNGGDAKLGLGYFL